MGVLACAALPGDGRGTLTLRGVCGMPWSADAMVSPGHMGTCREPHMAGLGSPRKSRAGGSTRDPRTPAKVAGLKGVALPRIGVWETGLV